MPKYTKKEISEIVKSAFILIRASNDFQIGKITVSDKSWPRSIPRIPFYLVDAVITKPKNLTVPEPALWHVIKGGRRENGFDIEIGPCTKRGIYFIVRLSDKEHANVRVRAKYSWMF